MISFHMVPLFHNPLEGVLGLSWAFALPFHDVIAGTAGGWQRGLEPVKKFGRVNLSTNFPSKQIWWRMQTWKGDEFLLGFKFSRVQTSRKVFMNFLNGILDIKRHDVHVWTVHGWLHFSWFGISASSLIYKLLEFYERPACSISYIFPLTAVLRLSSLS